jgi:hypothetical protein
MNEGWTKDPWPGLQVNCLYILSMVGVECQFPAFNLPLEASCYSIENVRTGQVGLVGQ